MNTLRKEARNKPSPYDEFAGRGGLGSNQLKEVIARRLGRTRTKKMVEKRTRERVEERFGEDAVKVCQPYGINALEAVDKHGRMALKAIGEHGFYNCASTVKKAVAKGMPEKSAWRLLGGRRSKDFIKSLSQ